MKLSTGVILTKGMCYVTIGVFTPWAAGLAQWIGSGEMPGTIIWIGVILPASALGGAGQLLGFLSSAYGDYRKEMNGGSHPKL